MKALPKHWLERCKSSLEKFELERRGMAIQEQRHVLSNHYEALAVIRKIVSKRALLVGSDHKKLGVTQNG